MYKNLPIIVVDTIIGPAALRCWRHSTVVLPCTIATFTVA